MDKIDNEWIKMYGKAKKYFNEHGNFEIDYESKNDEIKELYIWISEQCRKRRDNSLNPYKIELLNMLHIYWGELYVPDVPEKSEIADVIMNNPDIDANWLQMYEFAKRYYEIYGNLEVPSDGNYNFMRSDNCKKLYGWIYRQKQKYQSRKLSPKQIQMLEDIRIHWKGHPYFVNYDDVVDDSPKIVIPKIPELSEIVDMIVNNLDIDPRWLKSYELARRYYLINGNLAVPSWWKGYRPIVDGKIIETSENKLANWISTQRQKYQHRKLTPKQLKMLEDIKMIWDGYNPGYIGETVPKLDFNNKELSAMFDIINDRDWLRMYEFAKRYYELYSKLDTLKYGSIYNSEDSAKNLYNWILKQEQDYYNGLLGEEKMSLLEEIEIINAKHKKTL